MKKLFSILAAALFLGVSTTALAAPTLEENPRTAFRKQIQFLLNQNDISPDCGTLTFSPLTEKTALRYSLWRVDTKI